jgi:hypothetical protein
MEFAVAALVALIGIAAIPGGCQGAAGMRRGGGGDGGS